MEKLNKYDKAHQKNLIKIEKQITRIFKSFAREAAKIGIRIENFDPAKLLSFADYPLTNAEIKKLIDKLHDKLMVSIVNGVNSEWTLSNNKNNELCNNVFGDNIGHLSEAQYARYYNNNEYARQAFVSRTVNGLNLSDRVWKYTGQFKDEIEMSISCGLADGMSADEMARQIQKYLQHPDKLFRRVRNEYGELELSSRAKAYHPGQGVYRSSFRNARRLAVTEGNIAYHTADYNRWQDLDFVVGIEIILSHNHTCNGIPFTDICDDLKGKYPKDFKFTGWHPLCRCSVLTLLKTREEMLRDEKRIDDGLEPLDTSKRQVKDVPGNFKKWLDDNKERASRSTSVPYFLSDNIGKYVPEKYVANYASKVPYKSFAKYEEAMKYNKKKLQLSEPMMKNIEELNNALPVKQGKIMNIQKADSDHTNPNFDINTKNGYDSNCQTCTMAYELRRRGFNVTATPNNFVGDNPYSEFDLYCATNKMNFRSRYLTPNGRPSKYTFAGNNIENSKEGKIAFIKDNTPEIGRYEIFCEWKSGGSHVFIIEKIKNGDLVWIDPQTGRRDKVFNNYLDLMIKSRLGITRIDDKLINPKFAKFLTKGD